MAKRPVPLYDFKAFGAAIKAARNEYGESRKKVSDELYISPRYLANIENKGQQPSLQVFYDLVTRYHISVDQFFFPNSNAEKSTGRRQLDALLDGMSDKGIRIVTATAREILGGGERYPFLFNFTSPRSYTGGVSKQKTKHQLVSWLFKNQKFRDALF